MSPPMGGRRVGMGPSAFDRVTEKVASAAGVPAHGGAGTTASGACAGQGVAGAPSRLLGRGTTEGTERSGTTDEHGSTRMRRKEGEEEGPRGPGEETTRRKMRNHEGTKDSKTPRTAGSAGRTTTRTTGTRGLVVGCLLLVSVCSVPPWLLFFLLSLCPPCPRGSFLFFQSVFIRVHLWFHSPSSSVVPPACRTGRP